MSYPATILPAGEGRRGDLLPAPSPEISAAHAPVKRKLTGFVSVPSARVCSLARATSSASGPRLSPRSPAGASGRDSHKPVSCGGAGCASPSAALPGRAIPQSKPVSRFDRPALFPPQLFEAADNDGGKASPTDPGVVDRGRHFVTRHGPASNRRQYARAGLRLSPLSGGAINREALAKDAVQLRETGSHHPSTAALTSSAITADPRRADPGNLLAGAVAARLRLPNWPVALRGGGHIAGVA